jgi:hypothetical protein
MDKDNQFWNENGQSLVIVALIMVALLAMLAFALDGGNTYFQRRNAQNAADAAAIAGANAYCKENDYNAGLAAATNYANLNGGFTLTDFSVVVTPTAQINVTTADTFDTFFAGFIGRPQMTVEAVASSSCCVPGGADHIMPIAWACHRPNVFNQASSTSEDCVAQGISEAQLNIYLTDPPPPGYAYPYSHPLTGVPYKFYEELYIVMDSASEPDDLSTVCWQYDVNGNPIDPDPSTTPLIEGMDCDFDDDGENDLISNGDRSWVDLDGGGGGANDLRTWVTAGLNSPVHLPVWVDGQPGVTTSVFHDIDTLSNNFFLIPVFDAICPGDPSNTGTCPTFNGEPVIEYSTNGYTYRLVSFATFFVTCVDTGNTGCPGNEYLGDYLTTWDPNDTSGFSKNSTKTIEGYFVNRDASGNFDSDCSGTGIDVGTYVTRLTR